MNKLVKQIRFEDCDIKNVPKALIEFDTYVLTLAG